MSWQDVYDIVKEMYHPDRLRQVVTELIENPFHRNYFIIQFNLFYHYFDYPEWKELSDFLKNLPNQYPRLQNYNKKQLEMLLISLTKIAETDIKLQKTFVLMTNKCLGAY